MDMKLDRKEEAFLQRLEAMRTSMENAQKTGIDTTAQMILRSEDRIIEAMSGHTARNTPILTN